MPENVADAGEHIFGQLLLSFRAQVDEINKLFVVTVKMRMRIDEDHVRVFRRQLADDERMDFVGSDKTIGGARATSR